MNKSKQQRQDDAHNAAFERVAKQALALTFAFLRVDALFQKYDEEMQSITSSDEPGEQRRKSTVEATKRVENTPLSRADAFYTLQLAALYAVVERWQIWHFADPGVDDLLDELHVRLLEKHRHVVFHADYYDHKDLKALNEQEGAIMWAAKVAVAFRDYLRRWHADPMTYVTAHLERVGI
jgi:hypothetical protein